MSIHGSHIETYTYIVMAFWHYEMVSYAWLLNQRYFYELFVGLLFKHTHDRPKTIPHRPVTTWNCVSVSIPEEQFSKSFQGNHEYPV